MSVNTQNVIQALVMANPATATAEGERPRKPVVTVSRDLGSGGDEIARALAERLNIDYYDMEILDAVAKSNQVNASLLATLHERVAHASDAWLYSTVFGQRVSRDDYLATLVTTVRAIYRKGGVIQGRGGHVILAGRDALRVRVTGSVEACARRVAQADGIPLADARRKVRDGNRDRGRFVWNMFNSRLNEPANFDLVINTDHFADYGQVLEIIVFALRAMAVERAKAGTTNR